MRAKIKVVRPRRYPKPQEIDISKWKVYRGMTEQQEEFYKRTYFDYLNGRGKIKNIYFCSN